MTAPTLTDLKDSTFFENDVSTTPRIIDGDVTLTDAEGDLANGQLRVRGLTADDIISLFNEGTGAGQIGFNAATGEVTYGGLLIGIASGGLGADFTIAFNGAATLAAVEAVIEHLTYANLSDHPTANRTLTIDVTDAAGHTTGSVTGYASGVLPLGAGGDPLENGPVVAGDFDNDGDSDLVFVTTDGDLVFYEHGASSFDPSSDVHIVMDAPLAAGSAITVGDINSDGCADIVALAPDGSLRVFSGLGAGSGYDNTFIEDSAGAAAIAGQLPADSDMSLALADFNKDGFADLVLVSGAGQITTLLNYTIYGMGYQTAWTSSETATGRPVLADFNGDGVLDLVIALADGAVTLGRGDGMGGFDFSGPNPFAGLTLTAPGTVVALDVNGDGVLDLVAFDAAGFQVLIAPPPITNTLNLNVIDELGQIALAGLPTTVAFEEDAVSTVPQLLFGDLTLTDSEQDLANSNLLITPQSYDDRISVRHQGVGAGQVGFDGGLIYFGGVAVGQFQDLGGQFLITFSGAAPGAVEAVLENLTYANSSNSPQPSQLTLDLLDANSSPIAQYIVGLTINDNPEQMTVSGGDPLHRIEIGDAADSIALCDNLSFQDPEGDLDGSVFAVSGLEATDQVSLAATADLTVSGGVVSFMGQAIGVAAGGQGETFSIILNADATVAAVQAIIGALRFASPGAAVGDRVLSLALTDQGGHALVNDGGMPPGVAIIVYQQGDLTDLAPVLDLTLAQAATPHLLDSDVTVTGPDGSWQGARLVVTGMAPGDVIALADGAFDIVDDKGNQMLFLNGQQIGQMVDGGSSFTVYFNGAPTKASVEAIVEALTFTNAGATPDAARSLTLTLTDPAGLVSTDQIVVNIAGGVEYALELSDFATAVVTAEASVNGFLVPLDGAVTLRDTNGDYAGSVLTVSGAAATDILDFAFPDPMLLILEPDGDLIANLSTVIGHVGGGTGGQPLTVTFAAGVTTAQVELVLEALALRTNDPSTPEFRTLTLSMQNSEGEALHRIGETGPVTLTFQIQPTPEPFDVTGIDFNAAIAENVINYVGAVMMPYAKLTSPGGLPGGVLTVSLLNSGEIVSLRSEGLLSYDSATGQVSYDGQVVATTSRAGSTFTLTFGDIHDPAVITAVLQGVVLFDSNDNPDGMPRSLMVNLRSADGQSAGQGWKFTVIGQGEQTDLLTLTPASGVSYDELTLNAGPQPLVGDAMHDSLGEPVGGSILTVGGLTAGDRVSLMEGWVWFDEATGVVGIGPRAFGNVIGHAVVTEGVSLVVTFVAGVDENATVGVLEALGFSNSSDTPAATRTLTIDLVNIYGHPALLPGGIAPTLTVNVTPFHNAMVLTGLATSVAFAENSLNAAAQLIDNAVTLYGPDSTWDGGTLVIASTDAFDNFGPGTSARVSIDDDTLLVDGVPVATFLIAGQTYTVTFLAAATTEAVEQIIETVRYRNTDDTPVASHPVTLTLTSANGDIVQSEISLLITAQDDATVLTAPAPLTFTENDLNAGGLLPMAGLGISDVDDMRVSAITLVGFHPDDIVGLRAQGGDGALASIRGGTASYAGLQLTFSQGSGFLTITLPAPASQAQVQAILANLVWANTDDTPSLTRDLRVMLVTDQGHTSQADFAVNITTNHDRAVLEGFAAAVTFGEQSVNAGPQLLDANLTFTAVEGVHSAVITVSGLLPEDRLTLLGDAALAFDSATGEVSIGGSVVATLAAPGDGTAVITIAAALFNADRAAVIETILEHLAYSNSSDTPAASRDLTISIADQPLETPLADYQPAAPVTVTINVTPHHDAPTIGNLATIYPIYEFEFEIGGARLPGLYNATAYAPDSTSFAGGQLILQSTDPEDSFSFQSFQISGNTLVSGSTVLATFTQGPGSLTLTLVQPEYYWVESLLQSARLQNADDTPNASRQLTVTLSDSDGVAGSSVIDVTVVPNDDVIDIAGFGDINAQESDLNAGGVLLFPGAVITDPEGDFTLKDIRILNSDPQWVFSLRPQGSDAGVADLSSGSATYAGVAMTFSNIGYAIVIDAPGATLAQVRLILGNLVLSNASDTVTNRQIQYQVASQQGGLDLFTHNINVSPQYDPNAIVGLAPSVTFGEQAVNAAPQRLDAEVHLTSSENAAIRMVMISGLLTEDRLSFIEDDNFSWDPVTGVITIDGVPGPRVESDGTGGFRLQAVNDAWAVYVMVEANPTPTVLAGIEAVIEHLAYSNASDSPTASRTLTFQLQDMLSNGAAPPAPVEIVLNVTPADDPATLVDGGHEFTLQGGTLQSFAGDVSLVDPDGEAAAALAGGVLTVSGLGAGDRVSLVATVGAAGAVLQPNGEVWVDGLLVGQASGGQGSNFVITFNAAATDARVEAVIHQLGWSTATPQAGDHSLQLTLTPATGPATSQAVDFHVAPAASLVVSPLFTGFHSATVMENTANAGFVALDFGITLNPDIVLASGQLRLTMGYAIPTDAFTVINQGTGAGQIGYTKTGDNHTTTSGQDSVGGQHGAITWQGVEIGTFLTDSSYDTGIRWADFAFNANATPQAVQALLHAIGYTTSSDTPIELRSMSAELHLAPYLAQTLTTQVLTGSVHTAMQANGFPYYQSPNFVDVDADGDLDILFVQDWDTVGLLRNTGTAHNPTFVLQTFPGLPMDALDGLVGFSEDGRSAMLSPVDLDGDGDLDLMVGGVSGTIAYFENTGGPGTINAFSARTGAANAFNGLDFNPAAQRQQTSPALADLDGDGDLDLLVGAHDGHLRHYENTGTATAPQFTERHDFDAVAIAPSARPFLGDVDHDGDIDILVAASGTRLVLYENLGGGHFDATPRFFAATQPDSAYSTYQFSTRTPLDQIALTDLNGDGVSELYTADYLQYFRLLTSSQFTTTPSQIVSFFLVVQSEPEYIYGTPGDDAINGDARDTTILGYAGNDIIDGKAGADLLYGGLGNDTYTVDTLDTVVELDGEGTDTVKAAFSYILGDFVENLTLLGATAINGTGNALANLLTGNAAANTLIGLDGNDAINAGAGNDILDGGAGDDNLSGGLGADLMRGGLGNDIYAIDNAGDVADETGGGGVDLVNSALTWTLAAGLENLTLTGKTATQDGAGNDLGNVLTGNAYINTLTGLAGNDTLLGLAGEDVLIGGDGDDLLDGGLGADAMLGGLGNDTYIIDNVDDFAVEIGGGGVDTIQSKISWTMGLGIENLVFTVTGAVDGVGNAVNNLITGNLSNNKLSGMAGDDQLIGAAGNDTLDGGDGADILDGGAGIDILTGGAGTDTLTGGDGNDSLDGGTGADHLDGGLGNDTYGVDNLLDVIVDAGGVDTVNASVDFALAADLENLTLTGAGDIPGTRNALANSVIGNGGSNVLHGGAGIDTVSGMAGHDTLYGDAGIDTLLGGDGNDRLIGGFDADKLTGGLGADAFVFIADDVRLSGLGGLADRDAIYDLTFAEGDILDLSRIDANTLLDGDQAFSFAAKFTKVAGQATLKFASGITTLELDSDGDGKADLRIALTGDHSLTGGNLYTGAGDTNGGWIL
ncbi:MAG: Hemolysin-type calcium-binding region [Caulobacter sp.]|nr:Hemolysin-type calcium-binding region [Caulobacter sp.]